MDMDDDDTKFVPLQMLIVLRLVLILQESEWINEK